MKDEQDYDMAIGIINKVKLDNQKPPVVPAWYEIHKYVIFIYLITF